jgi:hypothetical protein
MWNRNLNLLGPIYHLTNHHLCVDLPDSVLILSWVSSSRSVGNNCFAFKTLTLVTPHCSRSPTVATVTLLSKISECYKDGSPFIQRPFWIQYPQDTDTSLRHSVCPDSQPFEFQTFSVLPPAKHRHEYKVHEYARKQTSRSLKVLRNVQRYLPRIRM